MNDTRLAQHFFRLACAFALTVGPSLPAHAQFGGLLQNLFQMQQEQAVQQQQEQARQQAENPTKRWAAAKPVPAQLQAAAVAFAGSVPAAPQMRPLLERLYIEGERNAALNFKRIGLAALAAGQVDMAEKAFEAAVARIEQIYADNPEAQKAKSLWTAEKIKDYKGEPYERAMAYFYRGLVYAARGDFQNARAMFKQADYQDTVAESEQYAGDFGLMPYMAGWASYCDGNAQLAKDFLQLAARGDKAYEQAATDKPVLVLVETGRVPFKYGAGRFGEALKWQPHKLTAGTARSACAEAGESCVAASFMTGADLGYQATTRGGRPIDAVLGGKASFKEGAQTVASVASAIGAAGLQASMMGGGRDSANLGMFGMLMGVAAQAAAASTQAQADIREWEQLPNTVWLAAGDQKTGAQRLKVALDEVGNTTSVFASRLVDSPSCQLYWGRSIEPLSLLSDAGPLEPGEHPRDPAFRRELDDLFR
jgi:tetratricopeptide (TPR) repeat protein